MPNIDELQRSITSLVNSVFKPYGMYVSSSGFTGKKYDAQIFGPRWSMHNFALVIDLPSASLVGSVFDASDNNKLVDMFEVPLSSDDPQMDLYEIAAWMGEYAAKPEYPGVKDKIKDRLQLNTAKEMDEEMDRQEVNRDWPMAIDENKRRDEADSFGPKMSFAGNRRNITSDICDKKNHVRSAMRKSARTDITTQNVGLKAVSFVRHMLDKFSFPDSPRLSYSGMRGGRVASDSSGVIEGVVTVNASLRTASNIGVSFDVPVEIRNGEMLEPSVVVVDGRARVIAQSTFSDLIDNNSIKDLMPVRDIYSAPLEPQVATNLYSNRIKLTRTDRGMFSVDAAKEELRKAVRGQSASLDKIAQIEQDRVQSLVRDLHSATETDNEQLIGRILDELDKLVARGVTTQDDINAMAWQHRNDLDKEAASGIPGQHDRPRPSKTPGVPKVPKPSSLKPPKPSALKPPPIPKLKKKPSLGRLCSKCNHAPCICPGGRKKAEEFSVHEGVGDLMAKINEEVNQMRNDGLQDIDIKLAVSQKYGDDAMNAVFEKTAGPTIDPEGKYDHLWYGKNPDPKLKTPLTLEECRAILRGAGIGRNMNYYQILIYLAEKDLFEPNVPADVVAAVKAKLNAANDRNNYLMSIGQ